MMLWRPFWRKSGEVFPDFAGSWTVSTGSAASAASLFFGARGALARLGLSAAVAVSGFSKGGGSETTAPGWTSATSCSCFPLRLLRRGLARFPGGTSSAVSTAGGTTADRHFRGGRGGGFSDRPCPFCSAEAFSWPAPPWSQPWPVVPRASPGRPQRQVPQSP